MSELQALLDRAVAAEDVPFVVAMTGNAAGTTWSGTAGEASPGRPATETTLHRIFSMTKAVGSTAAMILIDRGALSPDTPVREIIPAFGDLPLLEGFDGETPKLGRPTVEATVRHLATHTSGLVYEFWNADMPRYMAATDHPTILSGLESSLRYPLLFEPGTRWDYGIGIDWLSQVVEAVDGRRIDRFVTEEILEPLGMARTVFEVPEAEQANLATVKARGPDGHFVDFELAPPAEPEFYGMGHALYSTPADYLRFLRSFLGGGALDGQRILSEDGVRTMLANHTGAVEVGRLVSLVPEVTADTELFPGTRKTHSLGFVRMEEDVPGMRSAGSQGWAGVLNTHYWFDPANDVAAVLMTQTLPFVEPRFMALYEAFERGVYAGAS